MVDLLLVIALGSAVGDATFYADVPLLQAMLVITLIVGLNKLLDTLIERSDRAKRIIDGRTIEVARNGRILCDGLRRRDLVRRAHLPALDPAHGQPRQVVRSALDGALGAGRAVGAWGLSTPGLGPPARGRAESLPAQKVGEENFPPQTDLSPRNNTSKDTKPAERTLPLLSASAAGRKTRRPQPRPDPYPAAAMARRVVCSRRAPIWRQIT